MGFVQTRPTSGGGSKDNDVESNSDSSDGCDEVCIHVGPLRCLCGAHVVFFAASSTPQDIIKIRCEELRELMRERPCLPLKNDGQALTSSDLASGIRLPLYSCPWRDCQFSSADRSLFLHHIAGGTADGTHRDMLMRDYTYDLSWKTYLDYLYGDTWAKSGEIDYCCSACNGVF